MSTKTQQSSDLVNQYLDLCRQRDKLDDQFAQLKLAIAKFSQDTNQKLLKSGNNLLKIKQYSKTTFPQINQKGRKEVEEIMKNSKQWDQVIAFDITKLGLAYDRKELSPALIKKLTPLATKEKVIKITRSTFSKK
ncbi:hypothetical protein KKD37_02630 [Patescibacteria group bacterium]|nr:hypothetical protein [Patescibacteria group bacterium]